MPAGRITFTDEQVRNIKENLIAGVSNATLARAYQCGEDTIGRIRRGLTYTHVRVPGEEALRPQVLVIPMPEAVEAIRSPMGEKEEARASAESLARLQRAMEEKRVADLPEEAIRAAKGYTGG